MVFQQALWSGRQLKPWSSTVDSSPPDVTGFSATGSRSPGLDNGGVPVSWLHYINNWAHRCCANHSHLATVWIPVAMASWRSSRWRRPLAVVIIQLHTWSPMLFDSGQQTFSNIHDDWTALVGQNCQASSSKRGRKGTPNNHHDTIVVWNPSLCLWSWRKMDWWTVLFIYLLYAIQEIMIPPQ